MYQVVAVTVVFFVTYFFIVTERLHRTTIALAGALALLLLPGLSLSQDEAVAFVDWNTLGLLIGMMLIVAILKRTGAFRFLALTVARRGRGRMFLIFAGFGIVTAVASAFIDNVTTVLMIVPVVYLVADVLGKQAAPFLIMEIMMSNVGGMATMIGDPPNILVGSRALIPPGGESLNFTDFLVNLGPLAAVCAVAVLLMLRFRVGQDFLEPPDKSKMETLEAMDPAQVIKDAALLRRSVLVLGLVLAGFLFHHQLGLEPAALLLVITRVNPEEVLVDVEWGVLFFFLGLFVLVGALEKVGIVDYLARGFLSVSDSPVVLVLITLWGTAVLSAVLSAVPTVTVLIPVVQLLANHFGGAGTPEIAFAFWWALAAGACLGGNATVVGAAANMAVVGISEKSREPLTFRTYASAGVPVTAVCLAITSVYIVVRYL